MPVHRVAPARGRQDAARRASRRCGKRSTSAATTPPRARKLSPATRRCRARPAKAIVALARPRRLRLHQPLEFPAGDLPRPGFGGADGGQRCRREAGRADAADRGRAVELLHEAGIPPPPCSSFRATAASAPRLSPHPRIAGVVFTGSTDAARKINRALAAKDGPIVPLIAETGGINAMIVDATALPEQVADDVFTSAFRSAGQRCSALAAAVSAGRCRGPHHRDDRRRAPRTHCGRSADSRPSRPGDRPRCEGAGSSAHHGDDKRPRAFISRARRQRTRHLCCAACLRDQIASELTEEVFGPVLHVVRYRASELDAGVEAIARSGYGLTLGIHSRIDETVERVIAQARKSATSTSTAT